MGCHNFAISIHPLGFAWISRDYSTAAEAIASTFEEDIDEIQELVEELNKEIQVKGQQKQPKWWEGGVGVVKYNMLRRRQIKLETEAWEEAAKEYQELLVDMCEQTLTSNFPYVKSLFLGWFELLRDAIASEQELCKEGKHWKAYAPHFDLLAAGMMVVSTMNKLMALLMTGGGNGSACHIGEAIVHEARIHRFLEKTQRKNAMNISSEEEPDPAVKEQERLRKKVNIFTKKQKLHQLRKIVKQQDDLIPWGQDAQVKVGCRLIHILTETADIQPPVDQLDDGPPDIRLAFVHSLKTVETQRGSRRYGVIECDPLVRKGLEITNELGVEHLRVLQFVIAHVLARKQRPRALQSHLHQVLLEDGSGSAPSLCELLCNAFKGWDSNHMVWDMLAFVYSSCNMVDDALFVLANMKDLNIQPSIMTYNSLLHNLKHTDIMWDVYSEIKASGIRPSEYTNSIILDGLCKQSLIHEAVLFLQENKEREAELCVVSFNTLISGFCKIGFVDIAKSFFCMMFKFGLFPDMYSYNILIHGLCVVGSLEEALDFMNDMEKHGLGPDRVTYNIIAKGFRLLGMMDDVWKVTNRMLHRGLNTDLVTFTYTMLICGHCQTGNVEEGFRLREEMLSRGLQLSSISYSVLLNSLCKSGRMDEALRFLSEMENGGLQPDHMMYSIIIHGLCKLGEVQKAVQLYKEMCPKKITIDYVPHRSILLGLCEKGALSEARSYFDKVANSDLVEDIVLYNIMINKYAKLGNIEEAIQLYNIALLKGISPTIVTFNSLIYGFCKTRKLADARNLLNNIKMQGLEPTVVTYTTLVNAFIEEGNLEATSELIDEMEASSVQANRVTFTVVMKGLCRQGKLKESIQVLEKMIAMGLSPDQTSYNLLIQCFCKARDVDGAFKLRNLMLRHNPQPNHITYNILINGLCVFGDLKEADKLFSSLKDQNVRLSKVAYTTIIKAHCAKGDARKAMVLFNQMKEMGFEISIRDYSAVINRLCKRDLVDDAKLFLRLMLDDGISLDKQICSVMLHSFDQFGDFSSRFQLYALMIKCGFDQG